MTPPPPVTKPSLPWSTGAISAKGLREENQDRMAQFQSPFGEVFAVADGMGGMKGGATAAEIVASQLPVLLNGMHPGVAVEAALRAVVARINEEVFTRGHSGEEAVAHMGATLVVALLRETPSGPEVVTANIGDSRAYLYRGGTLQQLTRDHTAVQRLVDAGALSAADARRHPDASVLTRAIGQKPTVELDINPPFRLQPGDGILLCSDGLSGYADASVIAGVLARPGDASAVVQTLVELAMHEGSDDNITVQFARWDVPAGFMPKGLPTEIESPAIALPPAAHPAPPVAELQVKDLPDYPPVAPCAPRRNAPMRLVAGIGALALSAVAGGWIARHYWPAAPQKPPVADAPAQHPPAKLDGTVVVYRSGGRPPWLDRLAGLQCGSYAELAPGDTRWRPKSIPTKRVRVVYRPGRKPLTDCLVNGVPELDGAEWLEGADLPPGADVAVVLPKVQSRTVEPGEFAAPPPHAERIAADGGDPDGSSAKRRRLKVGAGIAVRKRP